MKITQGNLSNADRARLEQAKKVASTGTCKKRHGAVIVRGGSVLAVGINSYRQDKNYSFLPGDAYSCHAEAAAIRAAGGTVVGGTIYVARIYATGEEAMSKPCSSCLKAIEESGIKRVVYTIDSEINNIQR